MSLTENKDGTFTCSICKFVFGSKTIEEMGEEFNAYHEKLHRMVMVAVDAIR